MSTAARKHIAASGAHVGEYVDCFAKNCRLKTDHVDSSVFGAARLWRADHDLPAAPDTITRAQLNTFMQQPDALDYVGKYDQLAERDRLNEPWSYRSNYEYNLSGLDLAAFFAAVERFNKKNKTAEVNFQVKTGLHRAPSTMQVPVGGIAKVPLPVNQDVYKLRHIQITGNAEPRELQRLEKVLSVFITGKAGRQPNPPIFKTPTG